MSPFSILQKELSKNPAVLFAYLFGSYAQGKALSLSDIDVAVCLDHLPSSHEKMDLVTKLRKALGYKDVDVVFLNRVGLTLGFEIIRTGRVILCRNDDELNRFEMKTQSLYRDFDVYRRRHLKDLEEKYGL